MKPTLWGPAMWHLMLTLAWNCREGDFQTLLAVLLHDVPALLPCAKCQAHYVRSHARLLRRLGEPTDPVRALEWVYHLKDEVNKITKTRSIPLVDVRERLALSNGRVDDVAVADMLLLVAIHASAHGNDQAFVDLCHRLATLLALPTDSELLGSLSSVRRPIVPSAHRVYKNTRVEHGLPVSSIGHVRSQSEG